MPINVKLLKKVKARILAEPKTVDQNCWLRADQTCGTVGCIAGHTVLEAMPKSRPTGRGYRFVVLPDGRRVEVRGAARKLLGLSSDEADELFAAIYFGPTGANTPGTREHARAVARHITDFIRTHG